MNHFTITPRTSPTDRRPRHSLARIVRLALVVAVAAPLMTGCAGKAAPQDDAPTPAEIRRAQRRAEMQALAEERAARAEAARQARAEREAAAQAAAEETIVYDREKNRELAEWGERTIREREARERAAYGRVLTPAEREEVATHGKLLTDEERQELAAAEAERLAAEQEAAEEAAAEAAAAAAAAEEAAAQAAANERQAQIDSLRNMGGDQFIIERNRLIREGVIDAETDFRDPSFGTTEDE